MYQRYHPTDRQVCLAVALGIQSHPLIQNPPVYNPVTPAGENPEQIFVKKFRTYDGLELSEQGLTVSVFPTGGFSTKSSASLEFDSYTLGRPEPGDYLDRTKFRLTVQAAITESEFDIPLQVQYFITNQPNQPHGFTLQHVEPATQDNPLTASNVAEIYVVPAEEILRDYMTLLRSVIRDQYTFQPYGLRNPSILYTNYTTSNTIDQKEAQNLVFHKAETVVEFDIFETNLARSDDGLYLVEYVKVLDTYELMQPDGSIPDVTEFDKYTTIVWPETIQHPGRSVISIQSAATNTLSHVYHRTQSTILITLSQI